MAAALAVPTFVCKNPHRQRPPHTQQTRVGQELLVPLPVSMFAFGLSSFVGRSPPRPQGRIRHPRSGGRRKLRRPADLADSEHTAGLRGPAAALHGWRARQVSSAAFSLTVSTALVHCLSLTLHCPCSLPFTCSLPFIDPPLSFSLPFINHLLP